MNFSKHCEVIMQGSLKFAIAFTAFFSSSAAFADGKVDTSRVKEKFLNAETSKKEGKSFNFNEVDINGAAKKPNMDMVSVSRDDQGYGFVKIRLNWNNEMIDTAANLDR